MGGVDGRIALILGTLDSYGVGGVGPGPNPGAGVDPVDGIRDGVARLFLM